MMDADPAIVTIKTPPSINDAEFKRQPSFYLRALVLFLSSCITIGSYYVYDTPSALYKQLQDHYLFYNAESSGNFQLYFNLLYSVYSIPNILLPFLGGHFVDTVGMRVCIVVFSILVLLGQIITAVGVSFHSMATMLLGRLIFGLGGECLVVGQSAFISAWFHGKEVAFALGFILSISRLGSVGNDWGSPILAQKYGVVVAFWFGALLCLVSTLTAFLLACVDQNHKNQEEKLRRSFQESQAVGGGAPGGMIEEGEDEEALPELATHLSKAHSGSYFETPHPSLYGAPRRASSSSDTTDLSLNRSPRGLELERRLARLLQLNDSAAQDMDDGINEDSLWHLMGFDTMFWLLAVICLLCYGAIMPFNNMAQVYLLKYYITIHTPAPEGADCSFQPILPEWKDYCNEVHRAERRAGSLQSVPFLVAGILTPLIGIIIDRYGHRTLYILMGPLLLLATHFVFLVGGTSALIPLCGLGLAYSIIAAVIWPSVPLTVHARESSRRCGTAFGILTAFQNLSMAVFPMAIAALYEAFKRVIVGEYFFIVVSLVGAIVAVMLLVEDEAHGALLRKYVVDYTSDAPHDYPDPYYNFHHPQHGRTIIRRREEEKGSDDERTSILNGNKQSNYSAIK